MGSALHELCWRNFKDYQTNKALNTEVGGFCQFSSILLAVFSASSSGREHLPAWCRH